MNTPMQDHRPLPCLRQRLAPLPALLWAACALVPQEDLDPDGDRWTWSDDCAPFDAAVHEGCADTAVRGPIPMSEADGQLLGDYEGSHLGWSLLGPGDLDGDGKDDLVVAAPQAPGGGMIHVLFGPVDSTQSAGDAAYSPSPGVNGADAGFALDAGRFSRDDRLDLVVGAPGGGSGYGAVYLLSTDNFDFSLAHMIQGRASVSGAGVAVATTPTLSEGGRDGLMVGASTDDVDGENSGAVYVLHNPLSASSVTEAELKLAGEQAWDAAGTSVCAATNLMGDGGVALVVGAPGADADGADSGRAYVVDADRLGTFGLADADVLLDGDLYDLAGYSVACVGDLDYDGYSDLLIGAPGASVAAGAAFLVPGPLSRSKPIEDAGHRLSAPEGSHRAGSAVAAAGDVDEDGFEDLIVGAPSWSTGAEDAGAAWVVLGPVSGPGDLDADAILLTGAAQGGKAGFAVAGVGDVDVDGYDDVAIGAPYVSGQHGRAYVFGGDQL